MRFFNQDTENNSVLCFECVVGDRTINMELWLSRLPVRNLYVLELWGIWKDKLYNILALRTITTNHIQDKVFSFTGSTSTCNGRVCFMWRGQLAALLSNMASKNLILLPMHWTKNFENLSMIIANIINGCKMCDADVSTTTLPGCKFGWVEAHLPLSCRLLR
jgi:hypothetical protein